MSEIKIYFKPKEVTERMLRKRLDEESLAKKLGIKRPALHTTYLNNKRPVTKRSVVRLAKALECDPMEIADVVVEDEKGEG